jgi:hypothetical protein
VQDGKGATADEASWTPLDKLNEMERGVNEATADVKGSVTPPGIKLQMRIAMEHCDLGAPR